VGFADADVARVREATDLVDLAGERTSLRRLGKYYVGLCPLQPQRRPSFTVNPELHRFICFDCGARGEAIDYVRLLEHVGHDEAVELLAGRAGIDLRYDDR
jgi:DNA primase